MLILDTKKPKHCLFTAGFQGKQWSCLKRGRKLVHTNSFIGWIFGLTQEKRDFFSISPFAVQALDISSHIFYECFHTNVFYIHLSSLIDILTTLQVPPNTFSNLHQLAIIWKRHMLTLHQPLKITASVIFFTFFKKTEANIERCKKSCQKGHYFKQVTTFLPTKWCKIQIASINKV